VRAAASERPEDRHGEHAGAISAALFLAEFVGDTPWAHIDIAGTAMSDIESSWRTPVAAASAPGSSSSSRAGFARRAADGGSPNRSGLVVTINAAPTAP